MSSILSLNLETQINDNIVGALQYETAMEAAGGHCYVIKRV